MLAITRGRLLAAAVALGTSAGGVAAQEPLLTLPVGPVAGGCAFGNCAAANHGTYGPALFAVNPSQHKKKFPLAGPNEPSCVGRSSYPLTDWHYIRQFCGPTLQPGTCFGYHETKWRRWEQHCPNGQCGAGGAAPPALLLPPAGPVAPVPPKEEPKADTPKKDEPKGDDVPKSDPLPPPKSEPVSPPKVPLIPTPADPNKDKPKEPGKINVQDARPLTVPVAMPDVVPPRPDVPVIVPPLPK